MRTWLDDAGMCFRTGTDEATELTENRILDQGRTYIAATRIADRFGCDVIGIQYQQGLKALTAASDLAEGLLNKSIRPPVTAVTGGVIRDGEPIPHFNEVDECAGLDALLATRAWLMPGQAPETTLHEHPLGRPRPLRDHPRVRMGPGDQRSRPAATPRWRTGRVHRRSFGRRHGPRHQSCDSTGSLDPREPLRNERVGSGARHRHDRPVRQPTRMVPGLIVPLLLIASCTASSVTSQRTTTTTTTNLDTYRRMLVNHEVGHLLDSATSTVRLQARQPLPGRAEQGTRGLPPNPWPRPDEIARAARHDQPIAPGPGE